MFLHRMFGFCAFGLFISCAGGFALRSFDVGTLGPGGRVLEFRSWTLYLRQGVLDFRLCTLDSDHGVMGLELGTLDAR